MSGLYDKYKIEKTDGSEVDPNAQYFVLRLDTDEAARHALLAYSRHSTDKHLRVDIIRWLMRLDPEFFRHKLGPRLWLPEAELLAEYPMTTMEAKPE